MDSGIQFSLTNLENKHILDMGIRQEFGGETIVSIINI